MLPNNTIIDLVKTKAGLQSVRIPIYSNGQPLKSQSSTYSNGEALSSQQTSYEGLGSLSGGLVFDSLKLKYEALELELPLTLVEISPTKNIVKESIQGVSGTMKEYISLGDYMITLRGLFVSNTLTYPTNEIYTMRQLIELPYALEVESGLFQIYGIYNLVVEDCKVSIDQQDKNVIYFEMNCLSDKPIELLIEEDTSSQVSFDSDESQPTANQ